MDKKKYLDLVESQKKYSKTEIISFIIIALIVLLSLVGVGPMEISENGATTAKSIISGIFHPAADLIFSLSPQSVLYLLVETIAIAFLGTIFGAIFSIIPAFLGSNNISPTIVTKITRILLSIIRTVPAVIYGLMFISVTGPGPFAGVMTFSITSIGMITKLYIESIEDIDDGVIEALKASGASKLQTIRLGVIPQLTGSFLSTAIYRFEINVKDASILGLVGAGGLGTPLILAMAEQRWEDVGAYLLGLILLVLIVEFYSTKIRTKLVRG